MYIVAGVLFNKFHRGATGKEVIPNVNFWMDFPLLVKVCGMTARGVCFEVSQNIGKIIFYHLLIVFVLSNVHFFRYLD